MAIQVTTRLAPGQVLEKSFVLVNQNGDFYEWKSDSFGREKCTVYVRKASQVSDAVAEAHPGMTLSWVRFDKVSQ
jgi:hypothetical protein